MGLPEIENLEVWVSAQKIKKPSGRGARGTKPDPGIDALKGLILNFAVQGKLTSRNLKAEKAAELLLRVKKNWGDLKRNRIPKEAVEKISNVSRLPKNWVSTCLNDIALLGPKNDLADNKLASFVPMPMITTALDGRHEFEEREWGSIKKGYTHFANGDIGLAKITPCFENSKAAVFSGLTNNIGTGTTELHVARLISSEVDPKFVLLVLKSNHFLTNGIPRMTGTAGQKRVPRWYFQFYEFGLPPLEEQHRIVAKVDELMGLIDGLEAQTETARESHAELVDALLRTLVESEDASALTQNWTALSTHFDALFTTEGSVYSLKQTILDLAVHGKLVRQDNNELAVTIPKLRQVSKASTWNKKVFENGKSNFQLPSSWHILPLAQVSTHIVDCLHTTPKWTEAGEICVRTNQIKARRLDLSKPNFVSAKTYIERIARLEPVEGDILYIREGGILGVSCVIPPKIKLCLGQRSMLIRCNQAVTPRYLDIVLNSPFITDLAAKWTTGGAAPRVNMSTVRAYPIPTPPLAEQKRIVEKVDRLMALCDDLAVSIRTTESLKVELAESVVHHASAS